MKRREIDLICCHGMKGEVTPLRLRLKDEDGQYQAYSIREYKNLSHQGTKVRPDGVFVTDKTLVFECKIIVLGRERIIHLYSNEPYLEWIMTS